MASTLRDAPPQAAPPPPTPRSAVSERWRRLGRRERVVMALAVVALALVPALFSALRPATLYSEMRLSPELGERAAPGRMAPYIERMVVSRGVRDRIAGTRSRWYWLVDLELTEVRATPAAPGGQGAFVRVPGSTPGEAQEVARVIARHAIAQSRDAATRRATTRAALAMVDRALRRPGLSAARQAELERQRTFIVVQGRNQRGVAPLQLASGPTRPDGGVVDSLARNVVAEGVPRPNPLWAGLVGLLLGLALCALWLALPVRGRSP
jgi:hypothetical protein